MAGGPDLTSGSSGGGTTDNDDDDDSQQRSQSQSSSPAQSAGRDDRLDAPGGVDTGGGGQKDRSNEPDQSAEADDRLEAPGGPDTSTGDGSTTSSGSSSTESNSSENTHTTIPEDENKGLLDSAADSFESGIGTARDIDQTARNRLADARGAARGALFSVTGDARDSIEDRQREGFKSTRETTSDALDILVGNERVVGDDVAGGPLPVFSAVGGRSAAVKGVKGAKGFVNAARGVEQGTIRGAATGGSAGSGGAARAAARHGEFVVKGVDNVVDNVRAASATAGVGALAAAESEMGLPSDKGSSESEAEVDTPEAPSNPREQAEIDISGRESVHQSELGISEDVDQSEIDVNGPPGTTVTEDGEIQLPAQASGVVVKGKLKEEEEEEDEEEDADEEEDEEIEEENVVVEVPSEFIPDEEVTIGGQTSGGTQTETGEVEEEGGTDTEEVDEEILNEDFDQIQGDEFAEPDATEVEEVDRELEEEADGVADNLFGGRVAGDVADEGIGTGIAERGDLDFTGGFDDDLDGDVDLDFEQSSPGEDSRIDDRLDAPPGFHGPGQSTTTDLTPDLTDITGNPNSPGNPNNSGNPFEPSAPRDSGTPLRVRLPDLPDIDVDTGDSRRRRSGLYDSEFEIDPASPEDIISGDALDLDDIDFDG